MYKTKSSVNKHGRDMGKLKASIRGQIDCFGSELGKVSIGCRNNI